MWRGSVSPHSGGTVPDLHRIPLPLAGLWPETSIGRDGPVARPHGLASRRRCGPRVIFTFSSIPSLSTGLGTWDTILRKGAHLTEYAVLGVLLYRALGREAPALAAGIAYAASDELHQHFVRGRHASPVDVAIDAIGVCIGMLVWLRVRER